MAGSKGPSQEQLKLLEELSAGTALREGSILSKIPDWHSLQESGIVSASLASTLTSLHSSPSLDRVTILRSNPDVAVAPLLLLQKSTHVDISVIQYILTLFYDILRNDTSLLDVILVSVQPGPTLSACDKYLQRSDIDAFVADKAAFLLTSLIPRAQPNAFTDEEVDQLIRNTVNGTWKLSDYGRLDCWKNLMKLGRYRTMVWNAPGVSEFIVSQLDASKSCVYPAIFCAWVLTFNKDLLVSLTDLGGVEKVCNVLRQSKTEKVVRVCIHILLNCLQNDQSVEALIEQNAVHTLTLLEYEKWRDEELYEEIRDGLSALQHKIKLFSNFDRYYRELNTGKLHWSFLHSDKFWHQNVMHFEDNEFAAIKKLTMLLRSHDPVTSAVACFDLGEFARLHPMGKKVIQKFKAKEMVMMLMSHKDRDVSREALLCVQKMMLNRWQNAATNSGITSH